jgi:sulfatase modifying factor 1
VRSILSFIILFACIYYSNGQEVNIKYVKVPGGSYVIGSEDRRSNKKRAVVLSEFEISTFEITNAQFKMFVDCTSYVTLAEKYKNAQVYRPNLEEYQWRKDTTAFWRYPQGVSYYCVDTMPDHPVTGIAMEDALAFCKWASVRLPTLEEWEVACRAGSNSTYYWGEDTSQISNYGNIWIGKTHKQIDPKDSFSFTAPVGSFTPNNWGLYDMVGNVFELCVGALPSDKKYTVHARGGSWWCSLNSCGYFNSIDIGGYHKKASFSNIGFRVVK